MMIGDEKLKELLGGDYWDYKEMTSKVFFLCNWDRPDEAVDCVQEQYIGLDVKAGAMLINAYLRRMGFSESYDTLYDVMRQQLDSGMTEEEIAKEIAQTYIDLTAYFDAICEGYDSDYECWEEEYRYAQEDN